MRALLLMIILLSMAGPLHAVEDAFTISKVISSNAAELFYDKKYTEFNQLADNYRDNAIRLPDGRWSITFLYSYLEKVSERGDDKEWNNKLSLLDDWIKQTPNSPSPYIAKAKILIAYAWDARGGGWAKSVTKEQRGIFRDRINKARDVLELSSEISKKSPLWYTSMQTIAKAQSWEKRYYDALFEEGTRKWPTYYFLYFNAATYYLPRWHGSIRELKNFVNESVAKSKKYEGQTLYTRIYWSLFGALKDKTFSPGYADWGRMKQGFVDINTDYPDSLWNKNAFAYYACMAKDYTTANKLLLEIKRPQLKIWQKWSRYNDCVNKSGVI